MQELLMRCYYDGLTIKEAVEFIQKCYNINVPTKSLKIAKNNIKKYIGENWK